MDILATMKRAGLHADEMAVVCKVTKPTIYNWAKGTPPRSRFMYERAEKICELIEKAVDDGLLPLHPDTSRADRQGLINQALTKISRPA